MFLQLGNFAPLISSSRISHEFKEDQLRPHFSFS